MADEPRPELSPSAQTAMTMPDRLTAAQIQRLETVFDEMAVSGNSIAQAAVMSLRNKSEVQKRAIIANIFAQLWNMVLVVHMAVNSDQKVGDIRRALRDIRQGRSSAIEKVAESYADQRSD